MMKALVILATLVVSVYCAVPFNGKYYQTNVTSFPLNGLEVVSLTTLFLLLTTHQLYKHSTTGYVTNWKDEL